MEWSSEAEMLEALVSVGRANGWLVFHDNDARRNDPGFPDLVLGRPDSHPIFLELKTETGRVTEDQLDWGFVLETATVRPEDMEWWIKHLSMRIEEQQQRHWWLGRLTDRSDRAEKRRILKKRRKITEMASPQSAPTIQPNMLWPHGTMVTVHGRRGKFKYFGHSLSRTGVEQVTVYGPMLKIATGWQPAQHAKYFCPTADKVKQA